MLPQNPDSKKITKQHQQLKKILVKNYVPDTILSILCCFILFLIEEAYEIGMMVISRRLQKSKL